MVTRTIASKVTISFFIIMTSILFLGCGKELLMSSAESQLSATDAPVEKGTMISPISDTSRELSRKNSSNKTDKVFSFSDDADYCIDAVNKDFILLEESNNDNNGKLEVSFIKFDLESKELRPLYTPDNWNILFDPVSVNGNIIIEKINNSSSVNHLDYEIVSIFDDGHSETICNGNSYYYPLISKAGNGFSLITFTETDNGVEQNLSFYDCSEKKFRKISQKELLTNEDDSVSGEEIFRACGNNGSILYDISSYNQEIRQEGSNGKHILYQYSLDDQKSIPLAFQPGYLCNYFLTDGQNNYFIDRKDTNINLMQSGYIYKYDGTEYEKWIIPPITPTSSVKNAEFINDNIICAKLTTGIILIDLNDMSYWYKESYDATYSDGTIWYSEEDGIYSIKIKDIL